MTTLRLLSIVLLLLPTACSEPTASDPPPEMDTGSEPEPDATPQPDPEDVPQSEPDTSPLDVMDDTPSQDDVEQDDVEQDTTDEDTPDIPEPECTIDTDCPDDWTCCDGQCADLQQTTNHCGQCGRQCPIACSKTECVQPVQVDVGESHACAVMSNGTVRCWGSGSLGSPRAPRRPTHEVLHITDAVKVSAGYDVTCAVHKDGRVSCWGSNQFLQLGVPTDIVDFGSNERVYVPGVQNAVDIVADDFITSGVCAVIDDGTGICWGQNTGWRFGIFDDSDLTTDGDTILPRVIEGVANAESVTMGASTPYWLLEDGSVTPGRLFDLPPILIRYTGQTGHTCAVDPSGQLFCWGLNLYRQTGRDCPAACIDTAPTQTTTSVAQVDVGNFHTCYIDILGDVYCFGRNDQSQCAIPDPDIISTPTRLEGLDNIIQISCGDKPCCGIRQDGHLFCWGPELRSQGELIGQGLITAVDW